MKYIGKINIMPLKALLDPQGKAVNQNMENIGFKTVSDVRIGKHIEIKLEADDKKHAEELVNEACKKILSNVVMESYEFTIEEI